MSNGGEASGLGEKMYELASRLYPICRSITGEGVRRSLEIIKELIPLEIKEVATGTKVFDWTVPNEWNLEEAWIKDASGNKIVDVSRHNLHILNYSAPFSGTVSLEQLKPHIYTIPEQPDLIPYRTSYYEEKWGFCMSHTQFAQLEEGEYEVLITSSLKPGALTYGEYYLPGRSKQEFLLSTHICHPSLANDNLSGMSLMTYLATLLRGQNHRYSYRFLFIPGTIGSITWLATNELHLTNIVGGLVTSLVGDGAPFHFKKTPDGGTELDKVVELVLNESPLKHEILDFVPYGYDERQFCSPGINLDMGCLSRSTYGSFPEYHTSADNLNFIKAQHLRESLEVMQRIVEVWELNATYINTNPKCEPQMGKRGLYAAIGGASDKEILQMGMLWVLHQSNGCRSLIDISKRAGIPFDVIVKASNLLLAGQLLKSTESS
ncbi:MAG: DUF4910 domain-containing protein [Saprospiraceae bacterium]|nr:DUF4910 domain-containing protein [Saprospiraceae bacterium]